MRRAVCNEMFGAMELSQVCDILGAWGFSGIEIAPSTLGDDPASLSSRKIADIRSTFESHGITYAGLHWLFAHPPGLHVTSADPSVRMRALEHLRGLIRLSGELGGGCLILGSPKQRSVEGITPTQGRDLLKAFLEEASEDAREAQSIICIEALPMKDTNVLNTLAEASEMITDIGHPGISGMFDFHNCGDETLPWDELIDRNLPNIRHVHVNRLDGGHPLPELSGEYQAAFAVLAQRKFSGWVSLEIFSVPDDPHTVLRETSEFLDAVIDSGWELQP